MKYILNALPIALLCLSCGSKTEADSSQQDTLTSESTPQMEVFAVPCSSSTVEADGCSISVTCMLDSATIIRDSQDINFYDNHVAITITRNGADVFAHTFTKADFSGNFTPESSILQGMAFLESSNGQFIFGAQLGEPGNPEGGANFRVAVSGGTFSVVPDITQDTSSK